MRGGIPLVALVLLGGLTSVARATGEPECSGRLWYEPVPGAREVDPPAAAAVLHIGGLDLLAQRVLDEDEKKRKPQEPEKPRTLERKNPWLALGLSAALPGAGQFYLNPRSVLPFVYAGAEAVAWYLRVSWDHDGDEKTRAFERYAWQGDLEESAGAPLNDVLREDGNWSWERWRELYHTPDDGLCDGRGIEEFEAIDSTLVTFWFTNKREFYEDIGKYDKYDCGWVNPARRDVYRGMREEANDLLERSRNMAQVILLNHLASSLHAFFMAKSHNGHLEDQGDSRVPDVRMNFAPDREGGLRANLVVRKGFR